MTSHTARFGRRTSTGEPHKRRPNACEPCRNSKSRCDGGAPCSQCKKKRGKPQCLYRAQPVVSTEDRDGDEVEIRRVDHLHSDATDPTDWDSTPDEPVETDVEGGSQSAKRPASALTKKLDVYGVYSLARCIDEFKSMPSVDDHASNCRAVAQCLGNEVYNRSEGEAEEAQHEAVQQTADKLSESTSAAFSVSELPHMHLVPPALADLHQKAKSIQRHINNGQLVSAWRDFPCLVREAQIIGLDQDEDEREMSYLLEVEVGRRVWWHILELDVQISLHIGRPLTVNGRAAHNIPRPNLRDLSGHHKDLEKSKLDLRQFLLDILDKPSTVSHDRKYANEVDEPFKREHMRRMQSMQARLPPLPSLSEPDSAGMVIATADHQLEFHVFKLIIGCRLAKAKAAMLRDAGDHARKKSLAKDHRDNEIPFTPRSNRARCSPRHQTYEYQREILESARCVLEMFRTIHEVDNSEPGRVWTRCFAAYCAGAVLAIATIRQEVDFDGDARSLKSAWGIFKHLSAGKPESYLFSLAADRLGDLHAEINRLHVKPSVSPSNDSWVADVRAEGEKAIKTPSRGHRKPRTLSTANTTPHEKRSGQFHEVSDVSPHKRQKTTILDIPNKVYYSDSTFHWPTLSQTFEHSVPSHHVGMSDVSMNSSFTTTHSEPYPASGPMSAATSFHENDQLGCQTSRWSNDLVIPPGVHPPMMLGWPLIYQSTGAEMQQGPHEQSGAVTGISGNQIPTMFGLNCEETQGIVDSRNFPVHDEMSFTSTGSVVPIPTQHPAADRVDRLPEFEFRHETAESIGNPDHRPTGNHYQRRGSRMETTSSTNTVSARRRSAADVGNHHGTTWKTIETPAMRKEEGARGRPRGAKDGYRTPTKVGRDVSPTVTTVESRSTETFQPGDDFQGPTIIRHLIPPLPLPLGAEGEQVFPPQLHMNYARPKSAESGAQSLQQQPQQPQHQQDGHGFGSGTGPGQPHTILSDFHHQHDAQTWTAPVSYFPFQGSTSEPGHHHELVFGAQDPVVSHHHLHEHQMQPPILTTGPFEGHHYSTGWYH